MSETLIYSTSAAKSFSRLPVAVQNRLIAALYGYGVDKSGDVKRMVGTRTLRMRDGDYRVIFEESNDSPEILAVGNRRDIYR